MQNYAKIGGILSIVSGGLGCLGALMLILFAVFFGVFSSDIYYYDEGYYGPENILWIFSIIYGVGAVIGILISVLAVVGGIYGIKRKNWGLALAGSIAGVLTFFPCGVVAVIFTSLGKNEFTAAPVPYAVQAP